MPLSLLQLDVRLEQTELDAAAERRQQGRLHVERGELALSVALILRDDASVFMISGMGPSGIRQRAESHPLRRCSIRGTPLHAAHPSKDALLLFQPHPAMCHNW